jgi:hypothetical protein
MSAEIVRESELPVVLIPLVGSPKTLISAPTEVAKPVFPVKLNSMLTVPEASIVMPPAAFVMTMLAPADSVADTVAAPVDPIRI